MNGWPRAKFFLSVALLMSAVGIPGSGHAAVSDPVVTGPITGGIHGHPMFDSWFNLSEAGYEEAEYFVTGRASNLAGTQTAEYTTRIIVTRPTVASNKFNGTVLLDWTNVTAQFENAVDSLEAHEMLLREGFAWVHASVQAAGLCCTPLTPEVWDPVRYGSLKHPGDAYEFDIFSQIAKAIRSPSAASAKPMGELNVQRILASGQSQSASLLYTYVTQVQPTAGVIDGFLIHGGGSKTYGASPAVPVLHLLSDEEADPAGPNIAGSPTDPHYRLWEIAGTAHSDFWLGYHQVFGQGPRVLADAPQQPASAEADLHKIASNYGEQVHPLDATCILAGATMPMHYAASAAIHHLNVWVKTGTMPPVADRFVFDAAGHLAQDTYGNSLGGIRLPPIDVPVARYVSTVCVLGGLTVPFSDAQLQVMYPSFRTDYYDKMAARTTAAVASGFLLPEDGADLLARACAAKVRWHGLGDTDCA